MPKIPFTKMHGCGNDYIYVNAIDHPIADPARAAVAWSDRHKGIGSDGLVLIDRSPVPEADFSMRIFNADGSEAMMCGNASRCIGKYLYERGITTQTHIRLLTLSGVKMLELHVAPAAAAVPAGVAVAATVPGGFAAGASAVPAAVPAASPAGSSPAAGASAQSLPSLQGNCEEGAIGERSDGGAKPGPGVGSVTSVTVDMGEPVLEDENLFNPQIAKSLSTPLAPWRGDGGEAGIFVSMGNPHYVIFTDNIDQVADTGRALEHHPAFPQRCNIEFAKITDPTPGPSPTREGSGCAALPAASPAGLAPAIRTRVWERGSGITQACGTGACATAVAACITGRAGRRSRIVMDGGSLDIEWRETDNHVYMTGPAAFVFDGEVEIP